MSDRLDIQLLGPLTVARDGVPLPESAWRSRQERRLLALLLSARGGYVSIERLAQLLWPEAEPEAVGVTLRSAISSLRRTLEPSSSRASTRYILTRPGGYAWNSASATSIDVDQFLAHLDAVADDYLAPEDTQHLRAAIELYRDDYLADEPELPWAEPERERLRERYLHALHLLAERHSAAGDHSTAADLARRGLAHDPLHEPLYRTLMRAQALAGDTAGALRSYERFRQALDGALGAEPATRTRELHSAILRGEEITPEQAPPPTASAVPEPATPPFVGRVAELAALRGWVDECVQGHGGLVTLVGEAGIGKTRLLAEARGLARTQGATVIDVRASALDRAWPFAQLSEALRPLLRVAPGRLLRRLPPSALAQLAELLPLLRERLPDLPALPAVPPAERQNRQIDGLVDLALALARERPLVILCDDAQWADDATLVTIGRLARRAARRPLLIVLAYRSEELAENPALHTLLRSLGREMLLRPLLLGRLEPAEIAQLLAALAHTSPARLSRLAARLAERTGGNPLFLTVAVQALIESYRAPSLAALARTLDDLALPDLNNLPRLRDLVLARLDQLPDPARALLEQLALIGRAVSLDLIEQLAGADALDSAQTLLARRFLTELPDGRLAFGHDLVRSITAAALSSPRRRLLHRQVAEALAALYADQPARAAELANHFSAAGRGAEQEVLRYAVAAGDHARRSFGYRQALDHYAQALAAAGMPGVNPAPQAVRRAFVGQLLTYEALLDWDGLQATAARYEQWSAAQASPLPPLVTARRLVLLRALMGDLAGAATMSVAPPGSPQAPPIPALHDMLQRTATILRPADAAPVAGWSAFQPASPPPGQPASDLPALLGPDEAAPVLFQVGWTALSQGLLREAEPCLQTAYALAGTTGQAAAAVVSSLQLAHLHALRGQASESARWLADSLDLARQAAEAAWASIWPRIHQGFLWLLDDQFAQAQARFSEMSSHLATLPAFQSHRASVAVGLGLVALARGDLAQADTLLDQALALPSALYGFVYVAARHGQARLAALQGELELARATLRHVLDYSAQRSLLPEYVRSAIEIVRIERDFGQPAPALPLLTAAHALADQAGIVALASAAAALQERLATHAPCA